MLRLLIAAVFSIVILTGCSNTRVYPLTDQKFLPTPIDQPVKLYVNKVRRPHVPIAHVQSFADRQRDPDIKKKQLEEITESAREIGADAVINVRQMSNKVRGFVVDEKVPFQSYRQGRYDLYFIRGTAIKFVDEEAAAEYNAMVDADVRFPEGRSTDGGIVPTLDSRDREDDLRMEVLPRGLGPTYN